MSTLLKALRVVSDPTRLRLFALLQETELSVNELQEITGMAQSRVSAHLGHLVDVDIVQSRREGKRSFYSRSPVSDIGLKGLLEIALRGAEELEERASDQAGLRRALERRKDRARLKFNQAAGCFGRLYGPGRSWEGLGRLLLRLLPPLDVADLGSGEGLVAQLLAQRCRSVIAVDNSPKIVEFGRKQAKDVGITNLEFRLGDLEDPPLADQSVDVVLLSLSLHHAIDPEVALQSAYRILRPNGQVLILELAKHDFSEATSVYGDRWLGFHSHELAQWLESARFEQIEVTEVSRENKPPYLRTLLASGSRPGA